jgi:hypothetical protein
VDVVYCLSRRRDAKEMQLSSHVARGLSVDFHKVVFYMLTSQNWTYELQLRRINLWLAMSSTSSKFHAQRCIL